jgi:hypothetical protein
VALALPLVVAVVEAAAVPKAFSTTASIKPAWSSGAMTLWVWHWWLGWYDGLEAGTRERGRGKKIVCGALS